MLRAGGCGRCVSRDAVSGKVVHCHAIRRIPERNGDALCHIYDVTWVVSHAGIRLFSPQCESLIFTTTRRKKRFCMSKQSEEQIGVETVLTVCYSKNDSPIKMKRRKVIIFFSVVGVRVLLQRATSCGCTFRLFTDIGDARSWSLRHARLIREGWTPRALSSEGTKDALPGEGKNGAPFTPDEASVALPEARRRFRG